MKPLLLLAALSMSPPRLLLLQLLSTVSAQMPVSIQELLLTAVLLQCWQMNSRVLPASSDGSDPQEVNDEF